MVALNKYLIDWCADRLLEYFAWRAIMHMEKRTYHLCSVDFHKGTDRFIRSFFRGFGFLNLAAENCCPKIEVRKWALEGSTGKGTESRACRQWSWKSADAQQFLGDAKDSGKLHAIQTSFWSPGTVAASCEVFGEHALLLPFPNCAGRYFQYKEDSMNVSSKNTQIICGA